MQPGECVGEQSLIAGRQARSKARLLLPVSASRFRRSPHPPVGSCARALTPAPPELAQAVSCASERCELVSILGEDFVRLMQKSRAVRSLMHDVTAARKLE